MVQIDVTDDLIHIHGHAERDIPQAGCNVPCGQVSILGLNLAQALTEITGQPNKVLCLEKGNFQFDRKGLNTESGLLFRSFLLGLDFLSKAYPDKIRMTKL
jgi:uncharacterized protein YsxB (DUF464 family)